MSDTAWLFALLVALYLVECLAYVRRDEVVFRAWGVGRVALVREGLALGARGRLVPLMPLPPLGLLVVRPANDDLTAAWRADPAAFDADAARENYARWRAGTRVLRGLACGLWCVLFIAAPLLVWRFGLPATWRPLLVAAVALDISLALELAVFTRRETGKIEWNHVLVCALSPPGAARALDMLARTCNLHWLTLARVACPERERLAIVRAALYRVRAGHDTARLLAALQVDPAVLWSPPARESATVSAYCPCCHAQFTVESPTCPDCREVACEPYPGVARR